jgi:hypothetical protein
VHSDENPPLRAVLVHALRAVLEDALPCHFLFDPDPIQVGVKWREANVVVSLLVEVIGIFRAHDYPTRAKLE